MTSFLHEKPSLLQGIQQVLAEEQIGAPVFVRWVAATARGTEELLPGLGSLLRITETWIGSSVQRLYAVGPPETGQVTAMVDFASGQGALLTAALAPLHGSPHADLTLLGQRGAVYHESLPTPAVFFPALPSRAAARLATAVEESLRRRQPVEILATGQNGEDR